MKARVDFRRFLTRLAAHPDTPNWRYRLIGGSRWGVILIRRPRS